MIKRNKFRFNDSDENMRGFIKIDSCFLNNSSVSLTIPKDSIDLAYIELENFLKPGDSLKIFLKWTVKIPFIFSRFGHIKNHYEITQWYPKIPVYDKNGWHPYPYLEIGEFYYEFGNYDVRITLPQEYIVGCTGELISPESEICFLDSIANKPYHRLNFYSASNDNKTLHYKINNVHDFAWVANKDYHVLKKYYYYPNSADSLTMWMLILPENWKKWQYKIDVIKNSIELYSEICGKYPYSSVTVANGKINAGGGMEYPALSIVSSDRSDFRTDVAIAHEVGHNWFYGILGFNERKEAWMDEGLNSWAERKLVMKYYAEESRIKFHNILDTDYYSISDLFLFYQIGNGRSRASNLLTKYYSNMDYFVYTYTKPAKGFLLLEKYFGEDDFLLSMNNFYETWKFQHPQPKDLQQSFEDNLGENLNWFFEDYIGSDKILDYSINYLESNNDNQNFSTLIKIKNTGKLFTPVPLHLFNEKNISILDTLIFPRQKYFEISLKTKQKPKYAILDPNRITIDKNFSNNSSSTFRMQFFNFWEIDIKRNNIPIILLPYPYYDYTNGFQVGVAMLNAYLPPGKHEFILKRAYGFKSKKFLGFAHYKNKIYFNRKNDFEYGFWTDHTSDKVKYKIATTLKMHKPYWSNYSHSVKFDFQYVNIFPDNQMDKKYWDYGIYKNSHISYKFSKKHSLNNITAKISYKHSMITQSLVPEDWLNKIFIETKFSHRISKVQQINFRFFVGSFIRQPREIPKQEYYYANGDLDADFNDIYIFDRSGETWSSPMNNWYINSGVTLKGFQGLAGKLGGFSFSTKYSFTPIFAFFDIGDVIDNKSDKIKLLYDVGLGLNIGGFNIYLPLYLNDPNDSFPKLTNWNGLKKRWMLEFNLTKAISFLNN